MASSAFLRLAAAKTTMSPPCARAGVCAKAKGSRSTATAPTSILRNDWRLVRATISILLIPCRFARPFGQYRYTIDGYIPPTIADLLALRARLLRGPSTRARAEDADRLHYLPYRPRTFSQRCEHRAGRGAQRDRLRWTPRRDTSADIPRPCRRSARVDPAVHPGTGEDDRLGADAEPYREGLSAGERARSARVRSADRAWRHGEPRGCHQIQTGPHHRCRQRRRHLRVAGQQCAGADQDPVYPARRQA